MRWPSREIALLYLGLSLALDLWFLVVYGGSNWLNAGRSAHYSLYAAWELEIPLLPGMLLPYLSIGLFFLLPVFTLNREQLLRLAVRMAGAILVAGIIFNLLPTQLGFERRLETAEAYPLFELVYLLDQPHNLFPSLHVALSSILLISVLKGLAASLQLLLIAWWLLLCVSVIFVHQHHLLDIVGGLILAALLCLSYSADSARAPA